VKWPRENVKNRRKWKSNLWTGSLMKVRERNEFSYIEIYIYYNIYKLYNILLIIITIINIKIYGNTIPSHALLEKQK